MVHFRKMNQPIKVLTAYFFQQESGKEPVRDWLKSLTLDEKKAIGADIMSVEFGWPIGMPTVKSLGGGLWETRTQLKQKEARVIFCIIHSKLILLHGFIKKTQKTPLKDLEVSLLSLKKLKEIYEK
jgi:phage-related protein